MNKKCVILAYPRLNHDRNYIHAWMPFSLLLIAKAVQDTSPDISPVIFDGHRKSCVEWEELLREHCDDVLCIGMSIMTGGGQIENALGMAQIAKTILPDCPLVWGGPHVNVLPEETLCHPFVDVVLVGPGQNSMPSFIKELRTTGLYSNVPGLRMNKNGKAICGPKNSLSPHSIMQYPWDLIDVDKCVHDEATLTNRTFAYISSMGCPYQCRFCYEGINRGFFPISLDDVLADISMLVKQHNVTAIKFYDADFFIQPKRVSEFCDGLQKHKISIKWAASIHPNDIVKMDRYSNGLLEAVAKCGCARLLIGVESGSERILKEIVDKKCTLKTIRNAAKRIAEVGIIGSYTFIIGFPTETQKEKNETVRLIEELRALQPTPEIRVHVYMPYPGTPLYKESIELGFIPPETLQDWSRCDYYTCQTPWTSDSDVKLAEKLTFQQNLERRKMADDQKTTIILIRESLMSGVLPNELCPYVAELHNHWLGDTQLVEIVHLRIPSSEIQTVMNVLAQSLRPTGFYCHAVVENSLWIAFPMRVEQIDRGNASKMESARIIGEKLKIPRAQMRFEMLFETEHPPRQGDMPRRVAPSSREQYFFNQNRMEQEKNLWLIGMVTSVQEDTIPVVTVCFDKGRVSEYRLPSFPSPEIGDSIALHLSHDEKMPMRVDEWCVIRHNQKANFRSHSASGVTKNKGIHK